MTAMWQNRIDIIIGIFNILVFLFSEELYQKNNNNFILKSSEKNIIMNITVST